MRQPELVYKLCPVAVAARELLLRLQAQAGGKKREVYFSSLSSLCGRLFHCLFQKVHQYLKRETIKHWWKRTGKCSHVGNVLLLGAECLQQ